jgi:hypothetical protein
VSVVALAQLSLAGWAKITVELRQIRRRRKFFILINAI